MPQMAPISWLTLFILFTTALTLFCIMNYFLYMPCPPQPKSAKMLSSTQLTWKW